MALPFALGLAAFVAIRPDGLIGTADDSTALGLVFTAALAVTSIPVISRIMMDLGLLSTPFARVVHRQATCAAMSRGGAISRYTR